MNRKDRRKAASERRRVKVGDMIETKLGRVVFDIKPGDDISRDLCYICGKPATAWRHPSFGMAHGVCAIDTGDSERVVLLCEQCFTAEEKTDGAVVRKFLNAPDLKIDEGGTYEDIDEIRQIADAMKERDRDDKPTN
jgi:hypothetical protein